MTYLSPASKEALSAAVAAIERASSAEVVISLRPGSVPSLIPAAVAAWLGSLAGLAFLLFAPYPFSHAAIVLDTALCGLMAAASALHFPTLRRLCTPGALTRRAVQATAAAEFLERGIGQTRGRTGILVFVSQRERRARVLVDTGVKEAVPAQALARAIAHIEDTAHRSEDGLLLAQAIAGLSALLPAHLPRGEDDANELEDALCENG
jgi:putative membrane protein